MYYASHEVGIQVTSGTYVISELKPGLQCISGDRKIEVGGQSKAWEFQELSFWL